MKQKYTEIKKVLRNNKQIVFLFTLLLLYLLLDYYTILFSRPQGLHFIRQTDSLSFVANYYKNNVPFFEPRVFNLESINGNATCEFPILYYITALAYKLFGEHEFILRLFTISIVSFGFLSLFKLLCKLINDVTFAFIFTFIFLSSTVLLYYTNNYLPDPSALGLILAGWYYFHKYLNDRSNKKSFIFSFFLFSFGSLLKVTYFINPIAAIISIIIFDFSNKIKVKQVIKSTIFPVLIFFIAAIIVGAWNLYAIKYNAINKDDYFLVHSVPYWSMSSSEIAMTWDHIFNYWNYEYYYPSLVHFFIGLFVASLLFMKKAVKSLLILTLLISMGSLCYFILFFSQFKDHDYYFITLIPGIIFIVINSFVILKNRFPKIVNTKYIKVLLLFLCVLSLYRAKAKVTERYEKSSDMHSEISFKLRNTRAFISELGISEDAKFVIWKDNTKNGGLYFINHSGWNIRQESNMLEEIEKYVKLGANYLLITDENSHNLNYEKVGEKDGVSIFKID